MGPGVLGGAQTRHIDARRVTLPHLHVGAHSPRVHRRAPQSGTLRARAFAHTVSPSVSALDAFRAIVRFLFLDTQDLRGIEAE